MFEHIFDFFHGFVDILLEHIFKSFCLVFTDFFICLCFIDLLLEVLTDIADTYFSIFSESTRELDEITSTLFGERRYLDEDSFAIVCRVES